MAETTFDIYEFRQNSLKEWVWLKTGTARDACSAVEACKAAVRRLPGNTAKVLKTTTEEVYSIGPMRNGTAKRAKRVNTLKPIPQDLRKTLEKYLNPDDD